LRRFGWQADLKIKRGKESQFRDDVTGSWGAFNGTVMGFKLGYKEEDYKEGKEAQMEAS